jgi:hypothetical protein
MDDGDVAGGRDGDGMDLDDGESSDEPDDGNEETVAAGRKRRGKAKPLTVLARCHGAASATTAIRPSSKATQVSSPWETVASRGFDGHVASAGAVALRTLAATVVAVVVVVVGAFLIAGSHE